MIYIYIYIYIYYWVIAYYTVIVYYRVWLLLIVQCGKLMSSWGLQWKWFVREDDLTRFRCRCDHWAHWLHCHAQMSPDLQDNSQEPQYVWEPTWNMVEYHGMGLGFWVLWSLKIIPKPWTKPLQPLSCTSAAAAQLPLPLASCSDRKGGGFQVMGYVRCYNNPQ